MKSKILQKMRFASGGKKGYLFKRYLSVLGLCLWNLSSIAQNYDVTTAPQCNTTAAGNEIVNFTGATPTAVGNGTVTMYFKGDFDGKLSGNEYLDLYGETGPIMANTTQSTTGISNTQCATNYDSIVVPVMMADINNWASDGTITFTADGASGVSVTCPAPGTAYCVYMRLQYPRASGLNDIGIASVDSPGVFCAGPQDIWVKVQNYGLNQINSFTVNWTWNGVTQPPLILSQLIDTAQGLNPNTLQVMLGSKTITDADTLVVWTSDPNAGVDTTNINDTVMRILAPSLNGTYTINSAVATGGTNYQSFTDFADAITNYGICGPVVINVASGSGPYNEQITLPQAAGSSSTNTLTINGNGTTLTMSNPSAANYATLNLDGADYVTVNNLTIEALGTNGYAVHLMNSADNNTFTNCTITANPNGTGTTSGGVSMSGSATSYSAAGTNGMNNTFSNCNVTGGYFGFSFYGTAPAGNTNNNVVNCNVKDYYVYGVYLVQQGSGTVSGSIFERPTRPTTSTFYGVAASTGCTNMLIEKNRVRNGFTMQPSSTSTAYAMYCAATSTAGNENKFFNNVISEIEGNGTHAGFYLTGATHVQVYHNTVSLDYTAATAGTTYGIYATGTAGVDIKNNIVSITRGGSGTKYCLYFSGAGKTSNNNDLFIPVTATNNTGYYSTAFATLANWQTANSSAWDQASTDVAPLFANAASNDFTPGNSALDNLGAVTSVTTDITGAPRSLTTPDIGAYEFTVPPCSGTPAVPTATINDLPSVAVCNNGVLVLNAQGYSVGGGITYQWESSPTGQNTWSPIPGATNPLTTVTMTGPMDFHLKVTCLGNSSVSNTVSATLSPFYFCYCSPLTGTTLQTSTGTNYTTNVTIPGTSLNSSEPMTPGGYTQIDPTISTNTGTLFIGTPYSVNLTQSSTSTSINSEMWIDWDQSGTFDASEYYTFTKSGSSATTSVTPPATALTGMTGLRIRTLFSTTATFGASGACTSISTARETEDYVITVLPQPTCLAPSGLNATNITGTSATINWTVSPSTPVGGYDYYVSTSNIAPTGTTTPTGNEVQGSTFTNLSNLTDGTTYYVWVRAVCSASDKSIWIPLPSFSTPPVNDPCTGAIDITNGQVYNGTTAGATQTLASCNASTPTANDVWYSFTTGSVGGSVTVTVITTGTMDVVIEGMSGSCGSLTGMVPTASTTLTGTCIDGPAAGSEFGTFTVLPFTTYYVRVFGYTGAEGPFTIQATGTPLSIRLAEISAVNVGSRNRVNWTTAQEVNGDYFNVERSADGESFTSLSIVNANGQASTYTYWDETPLSGLNHYRLKMMDAAGNVSYSKVVKANVRTNTFTVEVYPNPVKDVLTVKAFGTTGSNATATITDVTGKVMKVVSVVNNEATINMSGMAHGMYLVKYSDNLHSQTIKVNKQ